MSTKSHHFEHLVATMTTWEEEALKEFKAGNGNVAVRIIMQKGGFSGVTDATRHIHALSRMADLLKSNGWPEFLQWEREALVFDGEADPNEAIRLIKQKAGCGTSDAGDYLRELRRRKDREDLMIGIYGKPPQLSQRDSKPFDPVTVLADALQRLVALECGVLDSCHKIYGNLGEP